jgi:hypothetical protein
MKIRELINALRSYDPELEFMISSEDDLWSVEMQSLREATLHETSSNFVVDALDYNEVSDGKIINSREVILIDLDA